MIGDLKPYSAYKDSGVPWLGEVPEHWEARKLRSILRAVSQRERPDLPLLSIVREKGVILRDVESKEENHNYIPDDLRNYKVVQKGQFAMNKMKAWQGSYGVSKYDGIVSPAYFIFNIAGVSGDYLHRAIRSQVYVPFFAQSSDGVRIGQWDLSQDRMKEIPFFVPPLEEQSKIATFLDYADRRIRRYIRSKQKLIKLLEEQKQVVINQAVTRGLDPNVPLKPSGIEWLGDIPEHWNIAALRLRYSVQLGKMLDAKRITGEYLVPYLRNTDVQWDCINIDDLPKMDIHPREYDRYTVKSNDLLVCEGGEVGRTAIWSDSEEVIGYQKALHRLRPLNPTRDDPRFLFFVLFDVAKRGIFRADGSENTIAHLTAEKIKKYRFAFPPLQEQRGIVHHIDAQLQKIGDSIDSANHEISLLHEFRTRLIADVVTGKLDVREAAAHLPVEVDDPEPLDDDLPEEDLALDDDSEPDAAPEDEAA
jgi:type I restriction enzyme S subunit